MSPLPLTRRALAERLPPWGVGVFESHHAPDFVMEWRRHPFLKFVYALAGAGSFYVEDNENHFAAGDLLVAPPGVRNRFVDAPGRPASLYVLCFSRDLLRFDPSVEGRLTPGRQPRSAELPGRVETLFRRLLFAQSHGGATTSIAMASAALELIHLLIDQPKADAVTDGAATDSDAISRYAERLDTHFFEATTIDAAAAEVGLSRRQFTRAFRAATGSSWLAYVHARAIDHATRLLVETEAPIASVAFECGFGDLSTFYRRFKARHGVSPAAFRERMRSQMTAPPTVLTAKE